MTTTGFRARLNRLTRRAAGPAPAERRQLRIAIVAQPARGGAGAERVVSELTGFLEGRTEVITVSPTPNEDARDPGFSYSGRLIEIHFRRQSGKPLAKATSLLANAVRLGRVLHQAKADVVVSSHSISLHTLTTLARLVRMVDTPVVIRFGNPPKYQMEGRSRMSRIVLRHLIRRADLLIANSAGVAQEVMRDLGVPKSKIRIIPNPCDVAKVQRMASEPGGYLPVEGRTIVTVGRLSEEKNHQLLIRAFAQMGPSQNVRLVIIGDGPLRPALQGLAKELGVDQQVQFLGWRANPFPILRQADVFCLSSSFEGFGYVLVEAMACGCPVIATDAPYGPRDILDGGKYGLLVPMDDVDRLAQSLQSVLDDDALREDLRVKGLERASGYDVSLVGPRYLEALEEVASGRRAAR